ncbi:MAG: DUF4157 domain-containing protein [Saprospiraceae bacterium]
MKTHKSTTEPVPHNNKDLFFGGMQKAGSFFAPTVQPKLTVNEPGDEYEQEADRLADQVMRMKDGDAPVVQRTSLGTGSGIMRKCDACEKEEEKKLHRKESGSGDAGGKAAPAVVSNVLSSGDGQPMDLGTRQFMESRFGQDFSSGRIYNDSRAAESAAAIQARAYTSGRDIVFGAWVYRPGSEEGRRLLAHELVHVGQQQRLLIKRDPIKDIKDWVKRNIANGRVDNRSGAPVTVWSSERGHFSVPAHTITPFSGEDVDHVQDINGVWYKIGVGTVTVNEAGLVSNAKCRVDKWGLDCLP